MTSAGQSVPQRRVQPWAVVSATLAPILLIGGWTVAAALQPEGFNGTRDTISALAGYAAVDRGMMTFALLLLGVCHITTASGLIEAAGPGRIMLALGGVATIGVAAAPLPSVGGSTVHTVFAFTAFTALAVWPLFSWRRGAQVSWGLRRGPATFVGAMLLLLVAAFAATLWTGDLVGLSERIAAGGQALWPAVVVWLAWTKSRTTTAA